MANLEYVKLDDASIETEVNRLNGWLAVEGKLVKSFDFPDYLGGLEFVSKVAHAAQDLDHHPDITLGYRKVFVSMNTHAVEGLSPYDFELARRIEGLVGGPVA